MDASLRPDDNRTADKLQNLSTAQHEAAQRAITSLNRANEIASGDDNSADPLSGFDKETATLGQVEDKLHNLSAMMQVIRQAKPDWSTWNNAEWDIDLAIQGLKQEKELREQIERDRKRGFRIDPILHRMSIEDAFRWAKETGLATGENPWSDINRRESSGERRLREANPDLPIIRGVAHWWTTMGEDKAIREIRLFKVDPEEAKRKVLADLGDLLTKDEQNLLMDEGEQLRKEEGRKEANREKVEKHREKYALTGDYIYPDTFPAEWSEEDILRYLSPPNVTDTAPSKSPEEARKERDRDRKRAARAVAKKPVEGSNGAAEPRLAPLAYRQKMAAIKAKLSHAMPPYWWLEEFDKLFDVMWQGGNSSAAKAIRSELQDWKDGVYEDEGGPKAA